MPLPDLTRHILEHTIHQPRTERVWYGPWSSILTTLFPSTEGFLVAPNQKFIEEDENEFTISFEVSKRVQPGDLKLQIVLIVEIKNSHQWPGGAERLFAQIRKNANVAFSRSQTTIKTVYWISVMGPHWRYGSKEDDGQLNLTPLIPWHDTTHDDASFNDLQTLAERVRAL